MNTSDSLIAFAAAVGAAVARTDERGRYGTRKVFVSAIWSALDMAHRRRLTADTFKARLLEAHRAQLLCLARADLVAAMSPGMVAASEIDAHGATFHFVVDDRAGEAWA